MRLFNTHSILPAQVIESLCFTQKQSASQLGQEYQLYPGMFSTFRGRILFKRSGWQQLFNLCVEIWIPPVLYFALLAARELWRGGGHQSAGTEGGPGQGEDPLHPLHLLHHLLVAALRRHPLQLELELGVRQALHCSCCEYQTVNDRGRGFKMLTWAI